VQCSQKPPRNAANKKENMSTDYQTSDPSLTLTRFWGGTDREMCIQITASGHPGHEAGNYIELTQAQARALLADLGKILAVAYAPDSAKVRRRYD
jgi:hypothetical protein